MIVKLVRLQWNYVLWCKTIRTFFNSIPVRYYIIIISSVPFFVRKRTTNLNFAALFCRWQKSCKGLLPNGTRKVDVHLRRRKTEEASSCFSVEYGCGSFLSSVSKETKLLSESIKEDLYESVLSRFYSSSSNKLIHTIFKVKRHGYVVSIKFQCSKSSRKQLSKKNKLSMSFTL